MDKPKKLTFDDLEESFNCPYCGSPYGRRSECCGEHSGHGETMYSMPDWSAWLSADEAQEEIDRLNKLNGYE